MSDVYARWGIEPIINAKGPGTRLSGGISRPEVRAAMADAMACCVDIVELHARACEVIARHTGGRVLPFRPFPGAFMAWSGDERRTVVDVYPRGREHVPAEGMFGVRTNPAPSAYSESHLALGVAVSSDEIFAIAAREGWLAQSSDRGGLFSVIELWVENKFLLELLTPQEQKRYADNMTIANLRALFEAT